MQPNNNKFNNNRFIAIIQFNLCQPELPIKTWCNNCSKVLLSSVTLHCLHTINNIFAINSSRIRITDRDPVAVRIVPNALEISRDGLLVLVPVSTEENALREHPRPSDQWNILQTRLTVDLGPLQTPTADIFTQSATKQTLCRKFIQLSVRQKFVKWKAVSQIVVKMKSMHPFVSQCGGYPDDVTAVRSYQKYFRIHRVGKF